jgi:hypothetical protein
MVDRANLDSTRAEEGREVMDGWIRRVELGKGRLDKEGLHASSIAQALVDRQRGGTSGLMPRSNRGDCPELDEAGPEAL